MYIGLSCYVHVSHAKAGLSMWDQDEKLRRVEVSAQGGEVWICLTGAEGGQLAAPASIFAAAGVHLVEILGSRTLTAGPWRASVDLPAD